MILHALKGYYDRKVVAPEAQMPPQGFEWKEIPFVIVLNSDGLPIGINSTYEGEGKKRRAKRFLVPQAVKRSSGIAANLFWDKPEYVLGVTLKGKPERIREQHSAFIKRIDSLECIENEGLSALKTFLRYENKEEILKRFGEVWEQIIKDGGNISFSLAGSPLLISEYPSVKSAIVYTNKKDDGSNQSICLVSGNDDAIEQLHAPIKGVYGAQTSGANIVSFNLDAFRSYGKKQGLNAPVGKSAAFAYTTALNHLLDKDSSQRMQVGEASTVFWSEKASDLESQWADFFGEPPKDDPDRGVRAVESLYTAIEKGAYLTDENKKSRFYVLGLSPNASRIAIRFWIVDTVAGMAGKIKQHFEDLQIVHDPKNRAIFSLFRLLVSIAALGKSENIPPNLAGATMRSILEGLPYPQTLLQAAVRRIRSEQEIPYIRAALIKACINRSTRFKNPTIKEELHMSLDENNINIGYRLGRLFAALERIQIRKFTQNVGKEPNSTIRDRYYGAASGTPATVFGTLIRLNKHHLASLDNVGERTNFERLIGEILAEVDDFPKFLKLEDQGRFAIGYYHQMQKFFTKKANNN